jgi:heptaprenyl diphosphate synthase
MRPFWDGHPQLARDLEEVRQTIISRATTDDAEVQAAVHQLLESSGKMLRPAFVILSSKFGEPDHSRTIRVAAAVEMLHMATLVHDDIIDGAATRRGIATLHAVRGARDAVLVGDWLFASCFSLVADLARTQENARSLSQLVARICGSELAQSADRYIVHTSVRRYLRRIAGKTAALFALSFHVGSQESGSAPQVCTMLRRLGYCLGMGFQIIDDILDFGLAGTETGKPTGSDLSQGIYTLPAILGLLHDDGRLSAALGRRPKGKRAVLRASRLIEHRGGINGARELARAYTERSLREIGRLPPNDAREVLAEVAERLLNRSY